MIIDGYLAGELGAIADDDVVADDVVVGDVTPFHQQVARADDGLPLGGCAAVDGDILANLVVVADDGQRLLALELQVLRDGADDGSREEDVAIAASNNPNELKQMLRGVYHGTKQD